MIASLERSLFAALACVRGRGAAGRAWHGLWKEKSGHRELGTDEW